MGATGTGDDTPRPVRRGGSQVGTVHRYASQRRTPPELRYLFKQRQDVPVGETKDERKARVRREREHERAVRKAEADAAYGRTESPPQRRPLTAHPALKPAVITAKATAVVAGAILKIGCGKILPWTLALGAKTAVGDGAFAAASAVVLALNARRVRDVVDVVKRCVGRSSPPPLIPKDREIQDGEVADIADALSVLRELESIVPSVSKLAPVPAVFFTPFVTIHIAPVVLRIVAPGVLRTLRFYGHLVPIVGGYVKCLAWDSKRVTLPDTSRNVQKKTEEGDNGQNGDVSNDDADGDTTEGGGTLMNEHDAQLALDDEVQRLWDERHEWGAQKVKRMILELGGFYLKVGQVFATKSDLLPPQYVAALKSVFDDCPPVPASKIDSILRKEFGNKPVSAVFKSFDTDALASATIAQVHVAHVDVDGKDTKVAVKVQNPGSERLMRMDMANMLFVSTFMDSLRVTLPFDHTSILKEYRTQVPLEFDFKRESAMLTLIGDAIHGKVPDVETPRVIPGLCTKRVVTVRVYLRLFLFPCGRRD